MLTIRRGKLGKARLAPIDSSVTLRLHAYVASGTGCSASRRSPSSWAIGAPA